MLVLKNAAKPTDAALHELSALPISVIPTQ
jgi:hypothetical protein